jgi:hypothetical protein
MLLATIRVVSIEPFGALFVAVVVGLSNRLLLLARQHGMNCLATEEVVIRLGALQWQSFGYSFWNQEEKPKY